MAAPGKHGYKVLTRTREHVGGGIAGSRPDCGAVPGERIRAAVQLEAVILSACTVRALQRVVAMRCGIDAQQLSQENKE
eukprot:1157870-Pelagomonas_calceolata.AAC.7